MLSDKRPEHVEPIKWAIQFTQLDLSKFKPEYLSEGVRKFFEGVPNAMRYMSDWFGKFKEPKRVKKPLPPLPEDELERIRKAMEDELRRLARPETNHVKFEVTCALGVRSTPGRSYEVAATPVLPEVRTEFELNKTRLARVFLAIMYHLVESRIVAGQIRICENRNCNRLFYLKVRPSPKKHYYCSESHKLRENERVRRARLKGEA